MNIQKQLKKQRQKSISQHDEYNLVAKEKPLLQHTSISPLLPGRKMVETHTKHRKF